MKGFVIVIRRQAGVQEEIFGETRREQSAINQADKLYSSLLLDAVSVIEVENGFINPVYKRERRCKHPNVQFVLTDTGIHPVCCGCDLVMEVKEKVKDEER